MNKRNLTQLHERAKGSSFGSSLTLAEFCLQRADFRQAQKLLEKRIGQGQDDFKTLMLLGISQAQLGFYEKASIIFGRLSEQSKSKAQRAKAEFNLGLVQFYDELSRTGDCTVAQFGSAVPVTTEGMVVNLPEKPFATAIKTWNSLIRRKMPNGDMVQAFLSFAYLQAGNLEKAVKHIVDSIGHAENFYITHYALGRIFLDLYYLASEGVPYLLPPEVATFFEVEDYEVTRTWNGRMAVHQDTYLDIAMQAFLEARSLHGLIPEVLIGLGQTYLLADMVEETQECLSTAESLTQDSLPLLELQLRFCERVSARPEVLRGITNRIKTLRINREKNKIQHVLPAYYLS